MTQNINFDYKFHIEVYLSVWHEIKSFNVSYAYYSIKFTELPIPAGLGNVSSLHHVWFSANKDTDNLLVGKE